MADLCDHLDEEQTTSTAPAPGPGPGLTPAGKSFVHRGTGTAPFDSKTVRKGQCRLGGVDPSLVAAEGSRGRWERSVVGPERHRAGRSVTDGRRVDGRPGFRYSEFLAGDDHGDETRRWERPNPQPQRLAQPRPAASGEADNWAVRLLPRSAHSDAARRMNGFRAIGKPETERYRWAMHHLRESPRVPGTDHTWMDTDLKMASHSIRARRHRGQHDGHRRSGNEDQGIELGRCWDHMLRHGSPWRRTKLALVNQWRCGAHIIKEAHDRSKGPSSPLYNTPVFDQQ